MKKPTNQLLSSMSSYFFKYQYFSYLTWFQPLYKVESVPGGIGSLHTTLPNSFTLASPPSSFKILTVIKINNKKEQMD